MRYEVLHHFTDLKDDNFHYEGGDIYPRSGYTPSEDRVRELSGNDNRQHIPLIKAIEEKAADDGKVNHSRRFTKGNNRRTDNGTV